MFAKWFFMAKCANQGRRFVIGLASEQWVFEAGHS